MGSRQMKTLGGWSFQAREEGRPGSVPLVLWAAWGCRARVPSLASLLFPRQPGEATSTSSVRGVEARRGDRGDVVGKGTLQWGCGAEWGGRQRSVGVPKSAWAVATPPALSLLHWALAPLSFDQYQMDW